MLYHEEVKRIYYKYNKFESNINIIDKWIKTYIHNTHKLVYSKRMFSSSKQHSQNKCVYDS